MSALPVFLESQKEISPYQAAVLRILLGLFFLGQALEIVAGGGEWIPAGVGWGLALVAVCFSAGIFRRGAAVFLWLGWAWVYGTQPLAAAAGTELTGVLLLFFVLLPAGEGLSLRQLKAAPGWRFPGMLFTGAWILLSVYCGWNAVLKIASPSWQEGSALELGRQSILAANGPIHAIWLGLPSLLLRLGTWLAVAAEVFFPLLAWGRRTRPWIWLLMFFLQILAFFFWEDGWGPLGLILFLCWLFDPAWLPVRKVKEGVGQNLVLYDGVCGMCNGTVQFLLQEDRERQLVFAALQGSTAAGVVGAEGQKQLASMVYVRAWGSAGEKVFRKSDAVLQILCDLGGFWRVLSWVRFVPRPLRDLVYTLVAKNRYRIFGQYEACPLPAAEVRRRFLE